MISTWPKQFWWAVAIVSLAGGVDTALTVFGRDWHGIVIGAAGYICFKIGESVHAKETQ